MELVLEQSAGEPLPASAQAHLESCAMCRQLLAELERIEAVARELPAEVEPPERVWISLRAQLKSEGIIRTPVPSTERAGWLEAIHALFTRPALAAGLLSMVILGAMLFSLRHANWAPPGARPSSGSQPVLAQAKIQLNNAENRILSTPRGRSSDVDDSLRNNLEIVDNFIAACEKTVQDNPQDDLARDYLSGAYQQKAELLATIQDRSTTGD
ncbi:MAG TPA: hypothetical protein VK156_01475 [Candidatus Limnocylindria bacterium]|nr:hypothetical protein [Candidatus Limnocylindria bacterium]